jgi:dGTPase
MSGDEKTIISGQTTTNSAVPSHTPPYERLLSCTRRRPSKVIGRNLEEEADADRGRVLFSAPFRRLQNKAQVFSLETNAAVRSRLTHSLEVSSIGRYVAQQALRAFPETDLQRLGVVGRERPLITFVETACLLHDLGNPPFGHCGEITISDWFHLNADDLRPAEIGGEVLALWEKFYRDFQCFDGNPQGLRIAARLQASETRDLFGLNLTATTLASTLKYPWASNELGLNSGRKKCGYFQTELEVVSWLRDQFGLAPSTRHPLVFLMEAADDIAYCISDIEDGIEKALVFAPEFASYMRDAIKAPEFEGLMLDPSSDEKDVRDIEKALTRLENPRFKRKSDDAEVTRLTAIQDLRSGVIRLLARRAGDAFHRRQADILDGDNNPLLGPSPGKHTLLDCLKDFAATRLYSSAIVRHRELTAHAVLVGLLDAYKPLMTCDRSRFELVRGGKRKDADGRPIGRESSLMSRFAAKFVAVYQESVATSTSGSEHATGIDKVMERIHRIRLIVDHLGSMTDEYALQSYQLISGTQTNPLRG